MFRKNARQRRKRKAHRKEQILNILYYWLYRDGLTMGQIAFWCQICPSTHLMGILKEMRGEGVVKALEAPHRPGVSKFVWMLTPRGEEIASSNEIGDWIPR